MKFGQSALTHVRWGSEALPLKPSVSACWETSTSVAIVCPCRPTACNTGISGSSTKG